MLIAYTVTEAGPSAFANIHENYYYVFVGCTLFFLIVAYFYFPYVQSRLLILTTKHRPNNTDNQRNQEKDAGGDCGCLWGQSHLAR